MFEAMLITSSLEGVLAPYVKEEPAETGKLKGANKDWQVTVIDNIEDALVFISMKILECFTRFFAWLNSFNSESKPTTPTPETKPAEPLPPNPTIEETPQLQPSAPVTRVAEPSDRFRAKLSIFLSGLRANAPGTKVEFNGETGDFKIIFPTNENEPLRATIKLNKNNHNAIALAQDAILVIDRELSGKLDLETGKVTLNGDGIVATKHYWGKWTLNVKEFEITDEGFFFKDGWKSATFSVTEIADTMTDVTWENLERPVVVKKEAPPVQKAEETEDTEISLPRNPFCLQLVMFANALKMHADGSNLEINQETGDFKLTFPTLLDEPLRATIGELKFDNAVKKAKDSKLVIDRELTGKIDLKTGVVTLNGNGIIVKKYALFKEWTLAVKEFTMNDFVFEFKTEWGAASYDIHQIVGTMLDVQWENLKPVEKKKEKAASVNPTKPQEEIKWADETEDFSVLFPKPAEPSLMNRVTTFASENSSTLIKVGSIVALAAGHIFGIL